MIGEVAAGYVYDGEVRPGTAVRIMTGAPIPAGADTIVPFEETDEPFGEAPSQTRQVSAAVKVFKEARTGANIRRAAEDIRGRDRRAARNRPASPGDRGNRLRRPRPRAGRQRPVVAVLSTGDELLEPGQTREERGYTMPTPTASARW